MIGWQLSTKEAERFQKVNSWLLRSNAHMAYALIRLGHVNVVDDIATAGVMKNDKGITFLFGRGFLEQLTLAELVGVTIHETLHVVFGHLDRFKLVKNPIDRIKIELAQEAVINDLILTEYCDLAKLPDDAVTGEKVVGHSTVNMSVEQVIKEMPDTDTLETELMKTLDDHEVWGGDIISGELDRTPSTKSSDEIVAEVLTKALPRDKLYGHKSGELMRTVVKSTATHNLEKYVLNFMRENAIAEIKWNKVNRKAIVLYPEFILPVHEPLVNRFTAVAAIDSSASVPIGMLSAAMKIARTPIHGTHMEIVSWDAKAYKVRNVTKVGGGGGTDLQCLIEYVDKMKKTPNIVFVFTDGWFAKREVKDPKKWVFLLPTWGDHDALPTGCKYAKFNVGKVGQGRKTTGASYNAVQ